MKLDARLTLFMTLVAVFLTTLLLGNLIGGKVTYLPIGDHQFPFSVGLIPFPLTFVLTDILNEFYGRTVVRRVTFLGLAMTALAFVMIHLAGAAAWVPEAHEPGWPGLPPEAFAAVFTSATRIQIASMCAYLVAQLLDITVFFVIKRATGNRWLWLRATGSTAISQLVDTILVAALAFGGTLPNDTLIEIIVTSYVVKLVVAIAMTPAIYALHGLIERRWGLEPVPVEVADGDVGGRDVDGKA